MINKKPHPVFKPQDRYFVDESGWWFFTVDRISGPFETKSMCVDACRLYIQARDVAQSFDDN